jgi:hypothetical protein
MTKKSYAGCFCGDSQAGLARVKKSDYREAARIRCFFLAVSVDRLHKPGHQPRGPMPELQRRIGQALLHEKR